MGIYTAHSRACPSVFSLQYIICFQSAEGNNNDFLPIVCSFRDHLKENRNTIQ